MCPFCYIGKRRFEKALEHFEFKGDIEVEWKSFQLNPHMETDPEKSINEYLAGIKGWTVDYARKVNDQVTSMAKEEGLIYNFDTAVVANSFDAHRLVQLAKTQKKGDAAEEALFHAYFTEGKNIADHSTLQAIGSSIGLDAVEVSEVLKSDKFSNEVAIDVYHAQKLGARGVPFFVLNGKYGVTGAQATEVFGAALQKSYQDWKTNKPVEQVTNIQGETCSTDGDCA